MPVTIITGASKGIGAATALHLASLGHAVAVGYHLDREGADAVVDQVSAAGGTAVAVMVDVTVEHEVDALFRVAEERLGPVTGLVANAGLTGHVGDLADTPVDIIRRVIDVNFLGVVLCVRRAAQDMSTKRGGAGGAVVTVSSAAATLGAAHEYVHYAGAKAAVDALPSAWPRSWPTTEYGSTPSRPA